MMKKIKTAGFILLILHSLWFIIFLLQKMNEEGFIVANLKQKLIIGLPLMAAIGLVYYFFCRRNRIVHRVASAFIHFVLWGYLASMAYLVFCTVFNPPITATQLANLNYGLTRDYVNRNKLGENIKLAVLASEDQLFPDHDGFDLKAIKKAIKYNKKHPTKTRGASTISQQTAKNIFLWQGGGFFRKALEVFYTFTIEQLWSKETILARYLNIVEMGPGIFGAEAAAKTYFGKSANSLLPSEAAMIAACLPNPKKYTVKRLSRYVSARSGNIMRQMNNLRGDADIARLIGEKAPPEK